MATTKTNGNVLLILCLNASKCSFYFYFMETKRLADKEIEKQAVWHSNNKKTGFSKTVPESWKCSLFRKSWPFFWFFACLFSKNTVYPIQAVVIHEGYNMADTTTVKVKLFHNNFKMRFFTFNFSEFLNILIFREINSKRKYEKKGQRNQWIIRIFESILRDEINISFVSAIARKIFRFFFCEFTGQLLKSFYWIITNNLMYLH